MLQGVGTSLRRGTGEGVPGRGISVEPKGFLGGHQAEKPAVGYLQGESGRCNRFEMGEGTRSAGKVREAQGSCRGGVGMRLSLAQGWLTQSLMEGAWVLCREPGTDAEWKRSLGRFKLKQ